MGGGGEERSRIGGGQEGVRERGGRGGEVWGEEVCEENISELKSGGGGG